MNSNSQFIAEWNEIFDYKIRESDLQKPNEKFVFNVLVDYLKKLDMNIAPLLESMNNENTDARRTFKIKFCSYIDHLYKISDESNSFVFFDLIKPSPKKTTHMLKLLLNYLLYLIMLREETVTLSQTKINELNDILEKAKYYKLEKEKDENNAERVKRDVEKNTVLLPQLKEQVETLRFKNKMQMDKIEQLEDTVKNYDTILLQLKCKEENLNNNIITDQEIESLLGNKRILEQVIAEQEEIKKVTLANNQNHSELINKMQPVIKNIESTMDIYSVEDVATLKELKTNLEKSTRKYSVQKLANDKMAISIETKTEEMANLEKAMKEKSQILQDISEKTEKEISNLSMNIESDVRKNDNLTSKLQTLEKGIAEQHENGDYILISAKQVFEAVNKMI